VSGLDSAEARPRRAGLRDLVGQVLPGEAATLRAAQEALDGDRRGLRALWPFLGPAFIASVAYLDPGNFATDVAGGAKYGYLLLWAVLASNLMAMLVQTLSAKLGIATGRNLAEVCRDNLPKRVSVGLWLQAEVIAMATDLAEVLGAALGLSLLFGIPLGWGAAIAVVAAFCILALQSFGFRRLEAVIAVFVGVIVIAFAFELLAVTPDPSVMADQLFSPHIHGEAVLLAVGIVGATVMPHVIYLHSALTQSRVRGVNDGELKQIQRFERIDVMIAMSIAGLVNLSMLAIFATRFFGTGADSIEDAYHGLHADPGKWAAVLLGIALLSSGLSSSSVGTLAGQIVMQGFIQRTIPVFARRAITAAPALAVALAGVDPSRALVLSQVVLSFGIPFALIPLVLFTSRREVMGNLVNNGLTSFAAWAIAVVISGLNVFLLVETFR
jgi:manganese transport protein